MTTLIPQDDNAKPLIDRIEPILCGHPPETQGVVLGDLTATWLAGLPDHIRDDVQVAQIAFVRELTQLYIASKRPKEVEHGHA